MNRLIATLLLALCFYWPFPREDWQANWGKTGSCSYAAAASLARYHDHDSEAQYIRSHFSGSAGPKQIVEALRATGLRPKAHWASFQNGQPVPGLNDYLFLATHVCVVGIHPGMTAPYAQGNHALILFHFDPFVVGIYDNNHSMQTVRYLPTSIFLQDWQGWAVSL